MLYLLHIDPPLGTTGRNSARFYLGYCKDGKESVTRRFLEHLAGEGAKITKYAVEHGHRLSVVWTGKGTRKDERRLKRGGHYGSRILGEE
jgi:predicted GIY-YIG superfamily endonuclease